MTRMQNWFHPHQISCSTGPLLSTHSCHSWQVHVLCQWLRKDSILPHQREGNPSKKEGEGPSLIISDMLTSEWGRLWDGKEWVWTILVVDCTDKISIPWRHELFSMWEKTMMDTSQQMAYLSKWSMQSTSLSPKLITLRLVSSCLIMHLATNIKLLMFSLHTRCPSFQTGTRLKWRGWQHYSGYNPHSFISSSIPLNHPGIAACPKYHCEL